MTEITDNDLKAFCKWYEQRFKKCCMVESVFVSCMCGHFHSHEQAMKEVLKRMLSLGLIVRHKNDTITIVQ